MDRYRRLERRRGLPLVFKAFLAASIVILGAGILWVGSGQVGPFVSSVVGGFGSFVSQVGAVAGSPAPTPGALVSDAPSIDAPDQQFTNSTTTDVTVNVPASVAGVVGYTVRLYVTRSDEDPALIAEVPVGPLSALEIPGVALADGRNDIQASVFGPAGESELSSVATWVLDTSKPKVSVISPKNGAKVTKDKVTIKGKSQALSAIRLQNDANGAIANATADDTGLWKASMAIALGVNPITITATDPAGNANTTTVNLRRGGGKLTVSLLGSSYRFKAKRLPKAVTFTATVTGSDGRRLAGATTLFTVSVPGLESIVSGEIKTNKEGVATFSTTIPAGALPGSGLATVLVSAGKQGSITDRVVLTVE